MSLGAKSWESYHASTPVRVNSFLRVISNNRKSQREKVAQEFYQEIFDILHGDKQSLVFRAQ